MPRAGSARSRRVLESSAAAYGDDDLDPVSGGDPGFRVAAFGDDFAIAFDGEPLSDEGKALKQLGNGGFRGNGFRSAVDGDIDHGIYATEPRILACGRSAPGLSAGAAALI